MSGNVAASPAPAGAVGMEELEGKGNEKFTQAEINGGCSKATVSRPETLDFKGVQFVLESAILQRLRTLFTALEIDLEENVTLDQVLFVCQHTELADADISAICHLVTPEKRHADIVSVHEFIALLSMVNLCQQWNLVRPSALVDLRKVDGTVLVDVGLGHDARTFAVDPPSHLEVGEVRVDSIKSHSNGSGLYRHICYDLVFSVGDGWDHIGVNRTRVQRRYSDFVWLHKRFVGKYAAVILPPLPAKKLVGNMDEAFVEKRRRGLQFYLDRVGSHPLLRSSVEFGIFISSTQRGMEALHKFCAPLKTSSWSESAKGLVTSVWSTVGSYMPLVGGSTKKKTEDKASAQEAKGTSIAVVAAPTTIEQDLGFAKISKHFADCRTHLVRILERTDDLLKHRRSLGYQMACLGHAVAEISSAEKSMRLRGSEGISVVGELLEKVAKLEQDTNDSFEATYIAQLKFRIGELEMAQTLLGNRKELFHQEKEAYRKHAEAKRAYASARASSANPAARKAHDTKKQAQQEINDSVKRTAEATQGIEKEVRRFEATKALSLRKMLRSTSKVMRDSYLRQKLLWADLARVLATYSVQNSASNVSRVEPVAVQHSNKGGGREDVKNTHTEDIADDDYSEVSDLTESSDEYYNSDFSDATNGEEKR